MVSPPMSSSTSVSASTQRRGWRFWLVFAALSCSMVITTIDLASIGTALPVIVHDLQGGGSFAWVSSAYTLASSAVLPLAGRLSQIYGRRDVLIGFLVSFTIGSVVCSTAHTMDIFIAGRVLQGLGNGGIQALINIIVSDVTTLRERGLYTSLISAVAMFGGAIGPFIAGAVSQKSTWRWFFYINLPLCTIAIVLVFAFLNLKKPEITNVKESILALDWIGNLLIIGSTTSTIIALTWAGVTFPWSSYHVLVPLIVGLVFLSIAFAYDAFYATHPSIPLGIINNRTSLSAYVQSFLHGVVTMGVTFYLPTYFQASKVATPILSALYFFPMAIIISPSSIAQGLIVAKTGKYWLVHFVGWCCMLLSLGLFLLLKTSTPVAVTTPLQLLSGVGLGFLYVTTFSVLAPLPETTNAEALSLLVFARTFSKAWGTAIGGAIIQNQLERHLPASFLASFGPGEDIAYSAIPLIPGLPQPLQDEVRDAFTDSLRSVWLVMLACSGAGLMCVFAMRELPLHTKRDTKWGMKDEAKEGSQDTVVEKGSMSAADSVPEISPLGAEETSEIVEGGGPAMR